MSSTHAICARCREVFEFDETTELCGERFCVPCYDSECEDIGNDFEMEQP